MSSLRNAWDRRVSPFFQGTTVAELARAHSVPILSVFAEKQRLLAIAKAVKSLVSET